MKMNKILTKTYREISDTKEYFFSPVQFERVLHELSKTQCITKDAIYIRLSESLSCSPDLIKKFKQFNNLKQYRSPATIEDCKLLGKHLCSDEYAFLVACKESDRLKSTREDIREVYNDLYTLLSVYDVSNCYNSRPNTTLVNGDEELIYKNACDDIIQRINTKFLFLSTDIKNKLIHIVEETYFFIRSYSIPGVVESWREINPTIMYFDPVYALIEELPQYTSLYSHIPSKEDLKKQKEYFEKHEYNNEFYNLEKSFETLFRDELLETLTAVFRNRFKEFME